jgi:hypothetical protein
MGEGSKRKVPEDDSHKDSTNTKEPRGGNDNSKKYYQESKDLVTIATPIPELNQNKFELLQLIDEIEAIEVEEVPYSEHNRQSISPPTKPESSLSLAIVPYKEPALPNIEPEAANYEGINEEDLAIHNTTTFFPEKVRLSERLKKKVSIKYITNIHVPVSFQNKIPLLRVGIDSLISVFPYAHFIDEEILEMYE